MVQTKQKIIGVTVGLKPLAAQIVVRRYFCEHLANHTYIVFEAVIVLYYAVHHRK